MVNFLSRREAAAMLLNPGHKNFMSVSFTKRTTGETRTMVIRPGATKGVKGTGGSYDPLAKGLVPVFSVRDGGWRSIGLESILRIRNKGETYIVS